MSYKLWTIIVHLRPDESGQLRRPLRQAQGERGTRRLRFALLLTVRAELLPTVRGELLMTVCGEPVEP